MSAQIRCLLGALASLSDLVLHSICFLHGGVSGVTCGWSPAVNAWQVSVNLQKTLSVCLKEQPQAPTLSSLSLALSHRKKCLLLNNFAALFGSALMLFSQTAMSFEMIMVGRFLYGLNAGKLSV